MNDETILVNQTAFGKLGRKAQTAHANVLSRLLLQRAHLFRKVRAYESPVRSLDVFQCRGEYDHVQRVKHASELIGYFVHRLALGDLGPKGHHELIRDAAVEEETRITQEPGEVLVHLVVGNHVRVAAKPVGGNIDAKNYLSHRPLHIAVNEISRTAWRGCRSGA